MGMTVKTKMRRFLVGGAGVVSLVAVGQALNLMMSYKSPPDAKGPRWGLEIYKAGKRVPSKLQEKTWVFADEVSAKVASWRKKIEMAGKDKRTVAFLVRSGAEDLHKRTSSSDTLAGGDGESDKTDSREVGPLTRRILFLGDSLVNGVGCEGGNGPALPRHAARVLAEKWKADVFWRALGITGGDVRALREELIPRVRDEVELINAQRKQALAASPSEPAMFSRPPIDAVFIVCGVNDWKKFVTTGRSWRSFRQDLEQLVEEIKELCGEECKVILPALPGVDFAPIFREPLRSIVRFASDCWDEQKRFLAEKIQSVHFVEKPKLDFWSNVDTKKMYANDRVHPNELGYSKWAEYLVESLLKTPTAPVQKSTEA